jgi:hypothetical protein
MVGLTIQYFRMLSAGVKKDYEIDRELWLN